MPSLVALFLVSFFSGCTSGSQSRSQEATDDSLSLENALAIADQADEHSKPTDRNEVFDEAMQFYNANNAMVLDPQSGCNQGKEALSLFVETFLRDRDFRISRINLPNGMAFDPDSVKPYTLRVLVPDSTGFFASWNYVATDTATFLSGWINSEVLEEITLVRMSSDQVWKLVEYYSAI